MCFDLLFIYSFIYLSIYIHAEKDWQHSHKNSTSTIEQVLEEAPHKMAAVRPPTTHHDNSPN